MKRINQYQSRVIPGKIFPGVTSITGVISKPELMMWYGKHGTTKCNEILKESQDFGSRVHTIIQATLKGQELTLNKDEQQILNNFLNEAGDAKEWLWFEKDFVHEKYEYGGTADMAYVDKDGKRVLADIKTGKRVYDEHYLQLCAYEEGLKDEFGDKFDYKVIFHLDQDSKSWEALIANTDGMFETFLHCREIYRWKNKK